MIPVPLAPLVGFVAALLTLSFEELLVYCQIDDAVGAAPGMKELETLKVFKA